MSVLVVTGTSTDVGKTIVTAALAAQAAARRGHRVAVVKPAQTGMAPGEPGDLAEVTRLSGVTDTHEYARYPDPLSPHHAAAVSGMKELQLADAVRRIVDLDAVRDTVIVEGAGGLLVPFTDDDRWTLADLAAALHAPVLVVTTPGLGTLNHTALTVGRLAEEGLTLAGVVIGSWPAEPDLAMRRNVADLAALGPDGRLAGVLPEGSGSAPDFRKRAREGLSRKFNGTFDSAAFVAAQR
ncbi:ATP-dependent dethiobiotin synthetase BioD [Jatrophihabitans fulvus]